MKDAHDRILQKAPLLKVTEQLNASTFVSSFLNIVLLGVLNFLFLIQAYVQGEKWKKLLIDWNEYQESNTTIGFQFHSRKLRRKICFTLYWTI